MGSYYSIRMKNKSHTIYVFQRGNPRSTGFLFRLEGQQQSVLMPMTPPLPLSSFPRYITHTHKKYRVLQEINLTNNGNIFILH